MKSRKKQAGRTYPADRLMLKTAQALIRDFRENLSDPFFCSDHHAAIATGDIERIRGSIPELDFTLPSAYRFKAEYQVASLLKRYRFEKDLYSDQELEELAISKFLEVQSHIRAVDLENVTSKCNMILDRARVIIAKVLGDYDDEECRNLCRFGRRASVGIPARAACEAARWELPISGSHEQISWFDSEMSQVDSVQDYWTSQLESDPNRSIYQETSSLKLTLVPKTFKALRAIMPNTTIGSYMSYGIGMIMRDRLKKWGYNISTLQMQHRKLAQRGSVHSQYVTADLSSASDTISVALVDRLFPDDWRDILHRSRIKTVELPDGRRVESETFCTMGIGYTFPLQTLVFLSLLKAMSLTFIGPQRNTISVYGDDMIYPSQLHSHVVELFGEMGFIINIDKTFDEGHFRESCGGDYYRGVDVRPFQPRNGSARVCCKTYEAMLYKYVNGLLARWTEYEIGTTLRFLLDEIVKVAGTAKVVPGDFPDDAGIKCSSLHCWEFLHQRSDVAQPKHLGSGVYRFSYLRLETRKREETRHEPYLWLALRRLEPRSDIYGSSPTRAQAHRLILQQLDKLLGIDEYAPSLQWRKVPNQTTRSKLTGRRLSRLESVVSIPGSTAGYKRKSGTSCFEARG